MVTAAISIEGNKIKASLVKTFLGFSRLVASEELRLHDAQGKRADGLVALLAKWKKERGLRSAVFGLDFGDFLYHTIELPIKRKTDIRRALPYEMEKFLPLPPDEYVFDSSTISSYAEKTVNLVLSVRRQRINSVLEAAMGAGVDALGIKCTFAEALNRIILEKHARDSVFAYESNGTFFIAGLKGLMPEAFSITDKAGLNEAVRRIEGHRLRTVYYFGPDSPAIEGAKVVKVFYPTHELLIRRYLREKPLDMDFLPSELRKEQAGVWSITCATLGLLCLALVLSTPLLSYYKDARALNRVEARLEVLREAAKDSGGIKTELDEAKAKLRFLRGFQAGSNINTRVLSELSRALPKEVWIQSLSSDSSGRVEIRGFAKNAFDAIAPLESSRLFKNIEFSAPTVTKDGSQMFSLRMEIER